MDRFRMLPNYQYHNDDTGMLETQYKKEMRDYQIYGNSIQDGTPSPDNPIEIQSVGEKTANICFYSSNPSIGTSNATWENYGNGYKFTSKLNTGGYSNWVKIKILHLSALKWGQTYTLSFYVEQSNPNMSSLLRPSYTSNVTNGVKVFVNQAANNNTINVITFTLPETQPEDFGGANSGYGGDYINLFINIQRAALDTYESIAITDIMLVEGAYTEDTMPEYEPANKYKIPIEISGKNLFDINNFQQAANSAVNFVRKVKIENEIISFGGYYGNDGSAGIIIPIEPGQPCSISWERVSGDYVPDIMVCESIGENGVMINWTRPWGLTQGNSLNITKFARYQPQGYNYLLFSLGAIEGQYKALIKNLQIEIAQSPTPYEPYQEPQTYNIFLDEPLRKIKDYVDADYIDFKNGKVVRNVFLGHITTASFIHSKVDPSKGNHCCMTMNKETSNNRNLLANTPLLATSFPNASNRWNQRTESIFTHSSLNGYLYLKVNWDRLGLVYDGTNVYVNGDENQTALTDKEIITYFTRYLNTLSEKEKEFIYVGHVSLETAIELPKPLLNKGTNIVKIKTTTQPNQVNWQYYK